MRSSVRIVMIIFVCIMWCVENRASAQFVQQGNKMIGTGAAGAARQGYSVALSADGNTALVGGITDSVNAGATWVYTRTGGVWSQQGSKLVALDAIGDAEQGFSVSLSADGNTALIGGPGDGGTIGAAWVYTRSGSAWSNSAKLIGSGILGYNAFQGQAVALSGDGLTAIVGGPGDNNNQGAAWVFVRNGNTWTQQTKLFGTGAINWSWQGWSVAISYDGNTAAVGGPYDSSYHGSTWIFSRSGSTWTQQARLVGSDVVYAAEQGTSVSLSADGNTVITGGPDDANAYGAVWVFTRSGSVWTQQGSKITGTGPNYFSRQGASVSLSSDGNMALVGADHDSLSVGAAWVFTRVGGVWSQLGSKFTGTNAANGSNIGAAVALSADKSTALLGGFYDNSGAGAAWMFGQIIRSALEGTDALAHGYRLEQNFPNPFNPSTTIRYTLAHRAFVKLTIFDNIGREIAVLVNREQEMGNREVRFDGTGLSSGMYFFKLQAGEFTQTRKLLLVR